MSKYDHDAYVSGKLELAEIAEALKLLAARTGTEGGRAASLIALGVVLGTAASMATMVMMWGRLAPQPVPSAATVAETPVRDVEQIEPAAGPAFEPAFRGRSGR